MTTKYDNSNADQWGFETRAIHAGQPVDSETSSRNLPIYLTSSYVFDSAEHAKQRFSLEDEGPIYSRLTNPTVAAVENRLASLEGGTHAVLFASGQAAETAALLNVARSGSHIVSSPRLYGGTETLLAHTVRRLGIEVTFVEDPDDPQSWDAAAKDNTVAFYGETFANPQADILDIPAIAEVAHEHSVPLIVDNTVATAAAVRPLELGADVVVASLTKFYTGNGSGLGGVLIDGGRDTAWKFIDALKLHSDLANVGDVRSLVVHPASTTHSQSDEPALRAAGINESTIRLSVGIEDIDDIINDLKQAFEQV